MNHVVHIVACKPMQNARESLDINRIARSLMFCYENATHLLYDFALSQTIVKGNTFLILFKISYSY